MTSEHGHGAEVIRVGAAKEVFKEVVTKVERSAWTSLLRRRNIRSLLPHNSQWWGGGGTSMRYRCEATSVHGFVQQLAVSYIGHGYWFYVTGHIPEGKNPVRVDEKLAAKYDVALSKWAKARRKRAGFANVHYIRFDRFFVLLATRGNHPFFQEEPGFKDIREEPIRFAGYSIGLKRGVDRRWHPSVRIHRETYRELRAHLVELATRRPVEFLRREFTRFPFEPYAPVCRQLFSLLRAVNRARATQGLEAVPASCLRLWRRSVKPFEKGEEVSDAA